MNRETRGLSFYLLGALFAAFVLFLYGPMFQEQMVGDFGASIPRSLILAFMVMVANVVISVAGGMAFRRRFTGSTFLFYLVISSLIVPSILVSLGIGLLFSQIGIDPAWYSSAFGAQLTWTIPFGLLIMFAVFNRFNKSWEEAARDLGASPWRSFREVVLPIILPGVIGIALFGFSLSYDEYPRTMMTAGDSNTLPLEIFAMTANVTTPVIYALGTLTTGFSAVVIIIAMTTMAIIRRRRLAKL
jgi:putative spermidine/putrescine transport system permease protein